MAKRTQTRAQRYRLVQDREPLETLRNGLNIVRCFKHEPIVTSNLSKAQLEQVTNKVKGSKFSAGWTLVKYVDLLTEVVEQLKWHAQTGPTREIRAFAQPTGISHAETVYRIAIVSDGRYVHAYPVK